METVRSPDGTTIAVETVGSGPPLVLVVGAFCDRTTTRPLAAMLADRFTVHAYDRRGRGDSPDVAPYAAVRELEDLAAVVVAAGPGAALYGHSSGAILALRAAGAGLPVARLVAYEPPWRADADQEVVDRAADLMEHLDALAAEGRGEAVVEAFACATFALPPEGIAAMTRSPGWAWMTSFAPSIPHEVAVVGDRRLPTATLAGIDVPTLVLAGADSDPAARDTASAIADAVPGARLEIVAGQGHGVDQAVVAPILAGFLG